MQQEKPTKSKAMHYAVYTVSYFAYGMLLLSLGPLIPFLTAKTAIPETEYSIFFTCRAAGMITGSLITTYIQSRPSKPTMHQLMVFASSIIILTNITFACSNSLLRQGASIFIGSIAYFMLEVSISICIILLSKKEHLEFWLMFINGIFGVGGFLSPILITILEVNTFYVIACIIGITIPFYIVLSNPSQMRQTQNPEEHVTKTIDARTEYLLSFLIFVYVGAVATEESWSSSFAVIAGVSEKQEAALFPALFLLTLTACRFTVSMIRMKSSQKLAISVIGVLVSEVISVAIVQLGFVRQALIFNSISMGVFMSAIYALIFSLSSEFDQPLTEKQASKIALWGVIGQGAVSPLCAKLMESFTLNMYFYMILALYVLMWYARREVMNYFQNTTTKKSEIEMTLFTESSLSSN